MEKWITLITDMVTWNSYAIGVLIVWSLGLTLAVIVALAKRKAPNAEVSGRRADDSQLKPGREPAGRSTDGLDTGK